MTAPTDLDLAPGPELPPDEPPGSGRARARWFAFLAVLVVCVAGIAVTARSITDPRSEPAGPGAVAGAGATSADQLATVRSGPHLTVRSTAVGPGYGTVALAPLVDGRPGTPVGTGLSCDRVAEGGGATLCLVADRGAVTSYRAVVYDDQQRERSRIDLPGEPSRARVSADGRLGAATVFVSGHAYSDVGFSTATLLIDLTTGQVLGNLEDLQLWRDGEAIAPVDRNYWGITFAADGNTFYATLSTGDEYDLVRGDVDARTLTVVRPGVECPMLSPDGTRVAFKSRTTGPLGQIEWDLAVMDLATGAVTITAETRSVDDQPMWLDDETVLYGLPRDGDTAASDVWAVPADGSGQPTLFLPEAWSPTIAGATAPTS